MNCLILGKGNWGKKLSINLKKIITIKKSINSSFNYKKIKLHNIDWVFISTPNNLHYKQTKYFLKKKINVFCEKPLAFKYREVFELIKLSYKNSVKLYIDDIETFKNKSLSSLKKKNLIFRSKFKDFSFKEVLYSLFYHDFYLLKKNIFLKSLKISIIEDTLLQKKFLIFSKKKEFLFVYKLQKAKKHFINKTNFISNKNYIKIMLKSILTNKVNFEQNHKSALFCSLLIDLILKEHKKFT
jgi:hypothetical protein